MYDGSKKLKHQLKIVRAEVYLEEVRTGSLVILG